MHRVIACRSVVYICIGERESGLCLEPAIHHSNLLAFPGRALAWESKKSFAMLSTSEVLRTAKQCLFKTPSHVTVPEGL